MLACATMRFANVSVSDIPLQCSFPNIKTLHGHVIIAFILINPALTIIGTKLLVGCAMLDIIVYGWLKDIKCCRIHIVLVQCH